MTTPLSVRPCTGQVKVNGSSTLDLSVENLTITGDEPSPLEPPSHTISMDVGFITHTTNEHYSIPPCVGINSQYPQLGSFWRYLFYLSHFSIVQTGAQVLKVTNWDWKATDQTYLTGGLLAQKVYTETCGGTCRGTTTFQLLISPLGPP